MQEENVFCGQINIFKSQIRISKLNYVNLNTNQTLIVAHDCKKVQN